MLDEYQSSYIDLNASFHDTYNFKILDEEPCDLSFSVDSITKDNTLSASLGENHSFRLNKNSNESTTQALSGFYNPKYKPILDDGKEYRYEDNPALYRKIRK